MNIENAGQADVTSSALNLDGTYLVEEDRVLLSVVMTDPAVEIADEEPLFYLTFRALRSGTIGDFVSLDHRSLAPEVYSHGGDQVDELVIEFNSVPHVRHSEGMAIMPNPSGGRFAISF